MRVVSFPPLIAVAAAMVLMNVSYPEWLSGVLTRLGGTLAPLALVSIGLQLRFDALKGNRRPLLLGLSYKLIAAPALIIGLYLGFLGLDHGNTRVTVLEASMGPQIGGAIVASQYGLNAPFVTLMVGVGTMLAFMTSACWWQILTIAG